MTLQRLAYVDDDVDIREIVYFALAEIGGLEVRCWDDGAAFLAARDPGWTPQLLLLDLGLPGMDGWQVLAALRAKPASAGLPVVLLSAGVCAPGAAPVPAGVLGCIGKPFDPLALAEHLHLLWARHVSERVPA